MQDSLNRYDKIAADYARKRKNPWKYFIEFLKKCEDKGIDIKSRIGDICCDLGSGTGRHADLLKKYCEIYIGTDLSFKMLSIANANKIDEQFVACDMRHMPFRDGSTSSVISIAVLHHLPLQQQRKKALKEFLRIIEKDGTILLSVWSAVKGKNSKRVKRHRFRHRMSCHSINNEEIKSIYLPWKTHDKDGNAVKIMRIYHLYTWNEIQRFKRFFTTEIREILGDERAGHNYFVLGSKSDDIQETS